MRNKSLFFLVVFGLLLTGCLGGGGRSDFVSSNPRIIGTLDRGVSSASLSGGWDKFEIWVVPIIQGNDAYIRPGTVQNHSKRFLISEVGNFEIDVTKLPLQYEDFVLLLMDPTRQTKKDQVITFIALSLNEDTEAIILPLKKLQGTLDMGTVIVQGDTAASSKTLNDNDQAFAPTDLAELLKLANYTNFGKLVINDYINYNDSNDHYSASVMLRYNASRQKVLNRQLEVEDFISYGAEIFVYTYDAESKFQIMSPSGAALNEPRNYGRTSATKVSANLADWKDVEQGWYKVYNSDTGRDVAEFDLMLSFVLDDYGKPVVPIPLVELEENEQGEFIGMWFNWVVEENGSVNSLDPQIAERLIDRTTFYIDYPESTFMFDRSHSGYPSMSGDFTYVKFDRPWTWDEGRVGIGFRFGAYRVSHILN